MRAHGDKKTMIGILVVTHGALGETLMEAAQSILEHPLEAAASVSVDLSVNADELRKRISSGIGSVNQGTGVLILTDMFGGTPSNLSLSFLEEGKVDVLSGVNLPILIRAAQLAKTYKLNELAEALQGYGQKSILLASSVLKGNKKR